MSITKSTIEHRIKKVQFWNPKETTATIFDKAVFMYNEEAYFVDKDK